MTAKEIIDKLAAAVTPPAETSLDNAVNELKLDEANSINREGFESQIDYLVDRCVPAAQILKLLGLE